jgi:hypothetical protein
MRRYHYYDDFGDDCAALTASLLAIPLLILSLGLVLVIPPLFKLVVALTGGLLGWLDDAFEGRLSENEALALLAAGGIWTLISLPIIVPLIPIALSQDPAACLLIPVLLLPGFLFGLACGYKAIEEGDFTLGGRGVLDLDGLLSVSYDGYDDFEGLLHEGVILGEETFGEEWFFG